MFKRAVLLASFIVAGCAPTETLYWVKNDGTRMDKNQALLRQLTHDKAVCQRRKGEITATAVGSTSDPKAEKPTAIVTYAEDTNVVDAFAKSDTIDKDIQAQRLFDACMKDQGYRKAPARAR